MKKILIGLSFIMILLVGCSKESSNHISKEKESISKTESQKPIEEKHNIDIEEPSQAPNEVEEQVTKCGDKSESTQTKCIDGLMNQNKDSEEKTSSNEQNNVSTEKSQTSNTKQYIPGKDVFEATENEELLFASKSSDTFGELKIKKLSRGETVVAVNLFKPEKRASVIIYGNWNGNNFDFTSYLGKEEMNITNLTVHDNHLQVIITENTGTETISWTFTQVDSEDSLNSIHNGEMNWNY